MGHLRFQQNKEDLTSSAGYKQEDKATQLGKYILRD